MLRFRGRVVKKARNTVEKLGPSGRLSNRQKYAHGDILVHEILEDDNGEIGKGKNVSLIFPNAEIPLWFRGNAWAEITGQKSAKSTAKKLIVEVVPEKSFLLRAAALRGMLLKGVDILKMREESGEPARTLLSEALYSQDVVSVCTLLASWGLSYGDAEDESEIVDLFARRAEQRNFESVSSMLDSNPYLLIEMGLRRVNDVLHAITKSGKKLPQEIELSARIGSFVRSYLSEGHSFIPFHHITYRLLQPYWKGNNIEYNQYGLIVKDLLRLEGVDLPHSSQSMLTMETINDAAEYYQNETEKNGNETFSKGTHCGVFFKRVIFAERLAAKLLAARIGPGVFDRETVDAALEVGRENGRNFQQLRAIENALTHKVSVIAGIAGTGKTAVLKDICKTLAQRGIPVVVLAPSATAAINAAADTSGMVQSLTIHRFAHIITDDDWGEKLDWLGGGKEGEGGSEVAGLVVVDECSLCNIEVLAGLLSRLESNTKTHLLLLGDPAQLPPIGPGGWFDQLVGGVVSQVPHIFLKTVFRNTGPIKTFAAKIRAGSFEPEGKEITVEPFSAKKIVAMVKENLSSGNEPMILCPDVQGKWGTRELNAVLRPVFNPTGVPVEETGYWIGDKIVCRKNDYADSPRRGKMAKLRHSERTVDVYNGTRGQIVGYNPAEKSLVVEWAIGENVMSVPYNISELPYWIEPAFAVTVHRAQGMQADNVIFVSPGKNISRAMLYTAVTRAKETITLLGAGWEKATTIAQKPLLSFFGFRVNRWLQKKA